MTRLVALRTLLLASLAVVLGTGWVAAGADTSAAKSIATTNLAELQLRIRERLDSPRFRSALWGIQVLNSRSGAVVFETNTLRYLTPASNTKLFTAALALDRLGTEYRIPTSFYAAAPPDARGTVKGDLLIYGRGDPTLVPSGSVGSATTPLSAWVAALTNAGIRSIRGDLVADESFWEASGFGSGWSIDDLPFSYSPEPSALTFHQNVVDLIATPGQTPGSPVGLRFIPDSPPFEVISQLSTGPADSAGKLQFDRPLGTRQLVLSGSLKANSAALTNTITVPRPALWLAESLGRALQQAGVRWKGKVRTLNWVDRLSNPFNSARWVEVARVSSPRLADLVIAMMKPSNNLAAHLLYLQVGANEPKVVGRTAEAAAGEAMKEFLKPILQGQPDAMLEEGSGLSRRHLVSAGTVVSLLTAMQKHPTWETFRDSLPIAGVDGTLRFRFRGTAAAGKLIAKTGTLRGVSSLSGYVTTAGGEPLTFSILLNSYLPKTGDPSPRDEVEAIALLLASFEGTSGTK
ncbi:MAG: D-alanyl-D-alanine carboxypeptidase/D-alanyl-D-alanine-endopeptidase [Verrucomicrobiales bacterium]|nr:D-alanyl-D-alanine carboxypeptidase/D-alanyl-D-alanine-endopeptidase [Verrucomicrobiales bacterium]